jgi:hypothetical protein
MQLGRLRLGSRPGWDDRVWDLVRGRTALDLRPGPVRPLGARARGDARPSQKFPTRQRARRPCSGHARPGIGPHARRRRLGISQHHCVVIRYRCNTGSDRPEATPGSTGDTQLRS